MSWNRGLRTLLTGGLFWPVLLFAALAPEVLGQVVLPAVAPEAKQSEDVAENVFLPADRRTLQRMAESRKLIAEKRFGEAVRYLGEILEGPEDFFFQTDKGSPIHRSLKAEAQRLIGDMPSEGRELYELQYGARARSLLDEALKTGDIGTLAEVSRRFFHTRAGYEATYLLGLHHFDHGSPLAGALTMQRLQEAGGSQIEEMEPSLSLIKAACWLHAGMADKARETLVALRKRRPELRVTVAGREVPFFTDDAEAVSWLSNLVGSWAVKAPAEERDWLMFGGNAARNAETQGGMPLLNMRWRVPIADDPVIENALGQYQRWYAEQGVPSLLALQPLAVGDVLFMRTARNLVAVDFSTGKRLWEIPTEDVSELATNLAASDMPLQQSVIFSSIAQRLWNDMSYGLLSSDGQSVFSIEDLGLGLEGQGNFRMVRGRINRPAQIGLDDESGPLSPCNRLAAYDIHSGKLKWHVGGPSGKRALALPDTYFLGPPLPLMGQLYVLGETKSEVRLMALDAGTGKLLWSQQLAVVDQNVLQDPLRRWSGASPSYADGVLVCPTSTGAIVGVELATRSLLWGYRYTQSRTERRGMVPAAIASGPLATRWNDAGIVVADGRVLATPVESDALYCLNLIDGALAWKAPREDNLYLACVDRGNVVLVGRREVRALRLSDGKPAWDGRAIALPDSAMPSGRGFFSGQRYFLPLDNAEVVGIDLSEGKIVQTAKSRKGDIPGNLLCHQGKVVSQGLGGVDVYSQLDIVRGDVERRLAQNGEDAEALSLRGEILLDEGKRAEAVASLQHAYDVAPYPRTRELLRDALLEGLRTEFGAYRNRGPEVERLLEDPMQEAAYLRIMADGLCHAGQWVDAFKYYEKLIDLQPDQRPLDPIDSDLMVRRDHWFRGQLSSLRAEADPESVAQIDAAVAARQKEAIASGSIERLEQFVDAFGDHASVAAARDELVRRLRAGGRSLEAELTARQLAAKDQAEQDSALRKQTEADQREQDKLWPLGKVEISSTATKALSESGYGRYVIEMRGEPGPFFSDTSIHFDDSRQFIIGSDGFGKELWRVSLADGSERQNFAYNRAFTHARANGHLLLLNLGWKIMAIDTLGLGRNGKARMLWTHDLMSTGADAAGLQILPLARMNMPWQWQHQLAQSFDQGSPLGPISSQYVCFQRLRSLTAVDPRNGQILWVRQNIPKGSEVFGDEEHLFVLSPEQEDAMLLRATDGALLGTRKVPRTIGHQTLPNGNERKIYARLEDSCLTAIGRRLLLWWPDGDQRVLTLVDPLEGRDVWAGRKFHANSRTSIVGESAVGILEPEGRFVLIGLPDGRTIADVQLAKDPTLLDITVLGDAGRYYLLTRSSGAGGNSPVPIQPMPGCAAKPIHNGKLYAFDESGKLAWPEPAEIKNQYLLLDQPARLPILSFASQVYQQKPNGQGEQKMYLLCIDKRNGRTAFNGEFTNTAGILDITGEPDKKTVELVMQQETYRLKFTDEPLAPPSPEDGRPPAAKPKGLRGLWNSIEKMIDPLN